jgi:hypothetical protein
MFRAIGRLLRRDLPRHIFHVSILLNSRLTLKSALPDLSASRMFAGPLVSMEIAQEGSCAASMGIATRPRKGAVLIRREARTALKVCAMASRLLLYIPIFVTQQRESASPAWMLISEQFKPAVEREYVFPLREYMARLSGLRAAAIGRSNAQRDCTSWGKLCRRCRVLRT